MDDFIIEVKQMSDEDLNNSINLLQDAYTKEEYNILKNEYSIHDKNGKKSG
jgi:hypothetical protein